MFETESQPPRPIPASASWLAVLALAALFVSAAWVLVPPGLVCLTRDDAIYALAARALAAGQGYVDTSLPTHPGVLRYPPGFPLLLAAAMAGSRDVMTQLVRAQWVPPLAGAAFLLLTFHFLRRRACLTRLAAVAVTGWVAFQPMFLLSAARVMADVPFAAIAMAGLLVFEAAFEAVGLGLAPWAGVGLLFASACLVRYAGVALVAAAALVLARERRWRALGGVALGLAAVAVPWALYRLHLGGSDYVENFLVLVPHDPAGLARAVAIVAASLFANALPGMLLGGFFPSFAPLALTPFKLVLGAGCSLLVIGGAIAGVARPGGTRTACAEAFLLLTLLLNAGYALGFTWYADNFLQRALVPVVPFAALAALGAVARVGLPARWRERLLAAMLVVGLAANVHASLLELVMFQPVRSVYQPYFDLFETVRHVVPPDAMTMAQEGHMVTLYTDRCSLPFPTFVAGVGRPPDSTDPRWVVPVLAARHVTYLVATPLVEWGERRDRTEVLVERLRAAAPGLLHAVWKSHEGNFGLYAIDPAVLDRTARALPAVGR